MFFSLNSSQRGDVQVRPLSHRTLPRMVAQPPYLGKSACSATAPCHVWLLSHPPDQPASQPASQPSCQPANQPADQPASQPAKLPASQPGCQTSCQPASQLPKNILRRSQPASQEHFTAQPARLQEYSATWTLPCNIGRISGSHSS